MPLRVRFSEGLGVAIFTTQDCMAVHEEPTYKPSGETTQEPGFELKLVAKYEKARVARVRQDVASVLPTPHGAHRGVLDEPLFMR